MNMFIRQKSDRKVKKQQTKVFYKIKKYNIKAAMSDNQLQSARTQH